MNITSQSSIYKLEEENICNIEGTVIDIETIGTFDSRFKDSRRCHDQKQVILGYINSGKLCIHCANGKQGIAELEEITLDILNGLERPFYAFNCSFEKSVWFHHIGIKIDFDGELQSYKYEKKRDTVAALRIPQYGDPFFDDGLKCIGAWNCGRFEDAIAHNRACLLKERDILIKRSYQPPEVCVLKKF
jgi:hypothetical protein